jgi:hypothetical protein
VPQKRDEWLDAFDLAIDGKDLTLLVKMLRSDSPIEDFTRELLADLLDGRRLCDILKDDQIALAIAAQFYKPRPGESREQAIARTARMHKIPKTRSLRNLLNGEGRLSLTIKRWSPYR